MIKTHGGNLEILGTKLTKLLKLIKLNILETNLITIQHNGNF